MEPLVLGSHDNTGWIEVVCGSMFSGKTEELIRRLRRAEIAGQNVESFKPALDRRYGEQAVVSHDETSRDSTPVDAAAQVLLLASGADVVGIDEAQFFGGGLVEICQELARTGTRVVAAGLDQDFRGQPFEPIPQLMAVAEYVTKLHAICMQCGAPANHSQRITADSERVLVGAEEAYEPRCRRCFEPPEAVRAEAHSPDDAAASSEADAGEASAGEEASQPAGGEQSSKDTSSTNAPVPPAKVNSLDEAPF